MKIEINSLIFGTYKVLKQRLRTDIPCLMKMNGFYIDDNKGENPELETLYIKNTLSKGNASFLKLDYKDHDIKLADAEFSLYQYNEETGSYTLILEHLKTNESGILEIKDLFAGKIPAR